jgi:hypothetical protein
MRSARAALFVGGIFAAGCSSVKISTPGTPQPPATIVDMSGRWSGTFDSANFATRTITLDVSQASACVDGIWVSVPAEWDGAISGFAGAASFSGQISFESTGTSGEHCIGSGTVSGGVGADTLSWTSTGFTGPGCSGGLPQAVVIKLQRQKSPGGIR